MKSHVRMLGSCLAWIPNRSVCDVAITAWMLAAFCAVVPVSALAKSNSSDDAREIELGRRIYVDGILPSGKKLTGVRFGSAAVSGSGAACVNCHRRSGMGQVEGDIQVPPVTGKYLYATHKDQRYATMDPRVSKSFNQVHSPYTQSSLAKAIIHGVNSQGRSMNVAMPRYQLDQPGLRALTAYLNQLSAQWSPGVTDSRIRFATVITPDVAPARRKAFIDMMQAIIRQKNGSTETASGGHSRHHMASAAEMVLGTERKWDLDIWELRGGVDSWRAQLEQRYRDQPVFAVVSGLSESTWEPIHDFCNTQGVPCWFPSVKIAPKPSQYAFYFSEGVILEAKVLAAHLLSRKPVPNHIVQIYRDDDAGRAASQALKSALEGSGATVEDRKMDLIAPTPASLSTALSDIKPGDVVMAWISDKDMEGLPSVAPVAGAEYYFSSRLAGAGALPLSADWKKNARLVYLYELPGKRELNLSYFHVWMNLHKFPVIDESMQSEVFFAMNYMTDTVSEMLDNIYRDYLVERAETMLDSREGSKAQQETRDRLALGKPGDLARKHGPMTADESVRLQVAAQGNSGGVTHGTTIYPHLTLGPEQRFASKGGYIVGFPADQGGALVAESGWIVP